MARIKIVYSKKGDIIYFNFMKRLFMCIFDIDKK